jgi:hypothetical protein
MGTIKGDLAGSTLGSDFDANNRTIDVGSNSHISTIRRDIIASSTEMQHGAMRTDYDKPWLNLHER